MTKGSVLDMIFIPVILLIIGITIFVASTVLSGIQPTMNEVSEIAGNATSQAQAAVNTFNWTFLIIAFALGMGAIIYAYLYPSHPIFMIFGIIMLVISMVTTAAMSNVFVTFSQTSQIASSTSQFTIINWFMENSLTIFMSVIGFLMLIVLYTRLQGGRE